MDGTVYLVKHWEPSHSSHWAATVYHERWNSEADRASKGNGTH